MVLTKSIKKINKKKSPLSTFETDLDFALCTSRYPGADSALRSYGVEALERGCEQRGLQVGCSCEPGSDALGFSCPWSRYSQYQEIPPFVHISVVIVLIKFLTSRICLLSDLCSAVGMIGLHRVLLAWLETTRGASLSLTKCILW